MMAVTEHCQALTVTGLLDELTSWHIGFVGTDENVAAVRSTIDVLAPGYEICAQVPEGFEQETLDPLYTFVQDHDGLVAYAHTKGAGRPDWIQTPWRREMDYHCFVDWRTPVSALMSGKTIAGSHWICGGPSSIPEFGTGGMFGGNFWWTHCEMLRRNVPPDRTSRFCAEHWIGQMSEYTPITPATIQDLNTQDIGNGYQADWVERLV